jgi:hypothetical protein
MIQTQNWAPLMRSKTGKKQKNLYLSSQARQLLAALASGMGISETAVVELLIREKADNETLTRSDRKVRA